MSEPSTTTPAPGMPDPDYGALLDELAAAIVAAQAEAVRRTNAVVLDLYWRIGRLILDRQQDEGYGSRLIQRLAIDLAARFGQAASWSPRNIRYMRAFALAGPDRDEIVQARLHNLGWTHHLMLIDRLDTPELRRWYLDQAIVHRWSSRMLAVRIAANHHVQRHRYVFAHVRLTIGAFLRQRDHRGVRRGDPSSPCRWG